MSRALEDTAVLCCFVRSPVRRMFLPFISSSGGSVYNVCAEEEEDGESCAAAQQSLENSITMNKMKLLKAKMEDMNLNKKVGSLLLKFCCLLQCVCGLHANMLSKTDIMHFV